MNITTATNLINKALTDGFLTNDQASQALNDVRAKQRMGNTMTPSRRASVLEHRWGITEQGYKPL